MRRRAGRFAPRGNFRYKVAVSMTERGNGKRFKRGFDFVFVKDLMANGAFVMRRRAGRFAPRGNLVDEVAVSVTERVAFFKVFARLRHIRYLRIFGSVGKVIFDRRTFAGRGSSFVFNNKSRYDERIFAVRFTESNRRCAVESARRLISAPSPNGIIVIVRNVVRRNNERVAVDFVLVGVEVFMADRAIIVTGHTVAT